MDFASYLFKEEEVFKRQRFGGEKCKKAFSVTVGRILYCTFGTERRFISVTAARIALRNVACRIARRGRGGDFRLCVCPHPLPHQGHRGLHHLHVRAAVGIKGTAEKEPTHH
eukprot:scaffold2099_cov252-Ochromonas_danica.AAC.1